jgi:hypothetical protein
MNLELISAQLASAGVSHNYVKAADLREAQKIATQLLKDKAAKKQVESIERDLLREANRNELSLDSIHKEFLKVTSWFVREYGRKNTKSIVDNSTVNEVARLLSKDFEENLHGSPTFAALNEADFYSSVKFGTGRSGSDAFLSFLHALKPFMIFGLQSFKQANNGNWIARGRYIVLEIGATDPKSLLNAKGAVIINYIKATTPSEEWETKFDKILREFTDSFQKRNAERVFAASEEEIELRDKASKEVQTKFKKAGFAFKSVSKNDERVRIEILGAPAKNIKKMGSALTGWKVTKKDSDETVFAKGEIRISVREKNKNTFIRIRHKSAKDWAARKASPSGNHVGIAPVYVGKEKLPAIYKKSGLYHAVKFQGRRVYYYKPVGVSDTFVTKLLDKSPVSINKYVRSGKVEIVAVYDAKTKKPFVRKKADKKPVKKAA